MKRSCAFVLFAAVLSFSFSVHAGQPPSPQREAVLQAATAWLALMDSNKYDVAARGMAVEVKATMSWPTEEEKIQGMTMILALPRQSGGGHHLPQKVERQLQPNGIGTATSCNCGIRDGEFLTFTYNVTYHWWVIQNRVMGTSPGTEVLYMLHERDGSWKPAALNLKLK